MTTPIRQEIRQPYGQDLLLTPAMADGYESVPAADLHRLRRYLEAVVAARRAPVHVAVAFNAAYFGFDLGGEGYGASPLDPDEFPVVTLGERVPALPVGAMVHITTGSEPLYAEIVYKEGRHPRIDSLGDVPGWVSGAPAGAQAPGKPCPDDRPVRRELLVPDSQAFGAALSLGANQLNRLRTRERWVDHRGHVLVDAEYSSPEAAELDDTAAYSAYLLTTARKQLLSPFVPVSIAELARGQDDETLHGALTRLFEVVSRALASSDVLRMWGQYAMTCDALAACWRDDGPLGGRDMNALALGIQHAAKPMARRRRYALSSGATAYTAVGPRLRHFSGAEPLLTGVGYAAAVCRANLAIGDIIRGESESGLFEDGTRVGLDDGFEGGGVWRSHHPGDADTDRDPLTPARLGWLATAQSLMPDEAASAGSGPGIELIAEPVDTPLEDDEALGPSQDLRISDSEVAWRLPLRLAHLVEGYLPLRPVVADELRYLGCDNSTVRLELAHPGYELEEYEAVQDLTVLLNDGVSRLSDVEWPLDFFPGLELHLQWPRGGRVIRATTTPLDTPVTVDDRIIEHRYDDAVLLREDAPGSDRTRDSAAGLAPRELVMRAVRRCGLLTPDRHALLDRSSLPIAVYGKTPKPAQAEALDGAVDELLVDGRLFRAVGSRGVDGHPHFPPRTGEQNIPLVGYHPDPVPTPSARRISEPSGRRRAVSLYYVPGHLRRIGADGSPGEAQVAAFREHCRRLGKPDGWELPPGYTFVTPHTRGR
ncbi:hypothetical protein [Streptomyces sp. HPF1205]|uniref:hypothetical protein n=1 Tax=Streptomyces sp. HPF1205 TaxID=2873262 RepID=UPI001CECC0AF|nr:hypothetical protein [Streptomyces sp. HPF1205]